MDSGSSLPLGSIAGIPVRLHVTFPLLFVMGLLAEAASYSWSGASVGWAAIMYGPVLLGTVLLHELGHCLAARQAGGHADGILLWPLGGLAYIAHASGPKADLFIALAGPATHIPQFLVWFACLFPAYHAAYGSWSVSLAIPPPQQHFGLAVVAGACQLNLALAAFNLLLPAYPLDGGRIFADLLLLAGLRTALAARTTASVATVLGLGVLGVGVWRTQVLTIAVGGWMLYTTAQLWKTIQAGTVDQHPMFSFTAAQQARDAGTALPAAGTGYSRYVGSGAV
ncbi:hypothetical protein D9Q98_010058 [Chlorella vulgaris]|uniref:Peptidase M50 domain-containing protein n=1 Tax=Chlorella vulgaris TaxID=3077 RepID=A0A9D4YWC0_CHLVU|nr:hypothetical protein D9Q98_010058 [Chlorella vulgaris]